MEKTQKGCPFDEPLPTIPTPNYNAEADEMHIKELMRPRVICVGTGALHYPNSPFNAGQILLLWEDKYYAANAFSSARISKETVAKYPLLFRDLPWWSARQTYEWPSYVRFENGRGASMVAKFLRVKDWRRAEIIRGYDKAPVVMSINFLFPITYAEYAESLGIQ